MTDGNMAHIDDAVWQTVRAAARRSYQNQRGFVDLDDLTQEGYAWVLKNVDKVNDWVAEGRSGHAQLFAAAYRAMHRYTMRERYAKDGTKPDDYYVYQMTVIQDLLPEAFNDDGDYGQSPADVNSVVRSNKPLSERGDRLAMIADIKAGLASLEPPDYALMVLKYGQGDVVPDAEIAQLMEVNQSTVNRHVGQAIRKIARYLGSEPVSAPRRRAMSNAQAQHVTREQE